MNPLVCQYLENVSGQALEEYPDIIQEYLRKRPGIYALYKKKRVYYVGLAQNLVGRLGQHRRDRHAGLWDRFSVYLTIGSDHMKELETLLLRIGKPAGNHQSGKFSRAENLIRRLKRDVRSRHRQKEGSILGEEPPEDRAKPRETAKGVLGKLLKGRSIKLRLRYKRQVMWARARGDGQIVFRGKTYPTPSGAAKVARGGKSSDGWICWEYEQARGYWVLLDEMRK